MEALKEIEATAADPVQEVLDRIAQESGYSPEQIKALYEKCKEVIERVAQVIREVWARIVEICGPVIERFVNEAVDALLRWTNDHPKWWHLYRYAKKARTRKKYRRRLMQQLVSNLEAAQKCKEVSV